MGSPDGAGKCCDLPIARGWRDAWQRRGGGVGGAGVIGRNKVGGRVNGFCFLSALRENMKAGTDMDKATIVARLREFEGELKAARIEHLRLHGSYARGTATPDSSDVDVIADFDRAKRFSLIGRVHLENMLTDILGVQADLADRRMLLPEVLERAEHESVLVF